MKTASLDFTAIDFEAANTDRASACAIGVAVVRGGIITHTRSWLIKPHTGIESFDRYVTRVHGINAQMVVNAKTLEESMVPLAGLIGDGPVLAHNIKYDAAVLRRVVGLSHEDIHRRRRYKLVAGQVKIELRREFSPIG